MGNLTITAAKLAEQDGRLAPFIRLRLQWYSMETKQSLLAAGIVTLQPVTPQLEPDWDAPSVGTAKLPASFADGRLQVEEIANATADYAVVAVARRAAESLASDDAQAGPIQ